MKCLDRWKLSIGEHLPMFRMLLDKPDDRGLFATASFDLVSIEWSKARTALSLLNHSSRLEKRNQSNKCD